MPRDRNWTDTHWDVKAEKLQSCNCDAGPRPDELDPDPQAPPSSPMFLRELEGEVLENVALSLLMARSLQRDFRILISLEWRDLSATRQCLFRISNFSYFAAVNAAHR
jgi:hypothetical protein